MLRKRIASSNILSIGYDPTSSTLEIEFHSGAIYQYVNVPESIYTALMSAPSHGSYFNRHIKDKYPWKQI